VDCYDLLVERDCDKACEAVPLALRARTSSEMRGEMCEEIGIACGGDLVASCPARVEAEFQGLALEAQLELDSRIADCRQCVVTPGRKPLAGLASDVAACSALLDGCRERCRQVRTVNTVLETASDAVTVCKNEASCFQSCRGTRAGGGSGGTAGDGGEGGSTDAGGAPNPEAETCLEHLLGWALRGSVAGGGMPGTGGTSAVGPGGQCSSTRAAGASGGAGVSGTGGQAVGADSGSSKPLSNRDELAQCALCIGSLTCDEIGTSCEDRCATVLRAR
jgi:hypothetical protein